MKNERSIDKTAPLVLERCLLKPGKKLILSKPGKAEARIFPEKQDEDAMLEKLHAKLAKLQGLLYAQHEHKVLIVLQGMDTSGKDGTIKHVFKGVNPQGVRVANFKEPTKEELDHDYLWRIHAQMPKKGEVVIFNRSHYEDVVAVRVHDLVGREAWERRFAQINDFERMLVEEGTVILKFFLNIDKDEQKERLQERLSDPEKNWKFSAADLHERKFWKKYMAAYKDALEQTTTKHAPWFVVPSDKKWRRNLAVSLIIIETLKRLKMEYPKPFKGLRKISVK